MSFCRFSSDNWGCDLYVYADCNGGYTVHVAGSRRLFKPIPLPGIRLLKRPRLWVQLSRLHYWTLALIPRVPIRLEHAGETFNFATGRECSRFVGYLRLLGYRVPKHLQDALEEEWEDEDPHEEP